MSARWLRMWACVLILAFPVSMMATDAVGLLSSSGKVWVGGVPSKSGAAVFSGDEIRTGEASRAVLTAHGLSVALGPNASLRVASADLQIGYGAVVVTAPNAVLHVNGTRIATAPDGKFLAEEDSGNLKIVALNGTLEVGDGQQQTTVPATTGVNVGSDKKDQASNPADTVPKTTRWLSNSDLGILIVVAAAVTAGVTLGIVNSNKSSASPATP